MNILGVEVPIWTILILLLILIVVLWRIIKFTLKILVVVIVFVLLLIGLDLLGFFSWIKDMFYSMLPV
ncbi:MAG: hypothetical protein QXS02_04555 [Candidatus Thermoplasmatota archaeon]